MTPLRLQPGEDLRTALELNLQREFPNGAFVVCGIGSLSSVALRLAGANTPVTLDGAYEILTLSGTISAAISPRNCASRSRPG